MSLCMSGLDYRKADICLRERLSFSKSAVTELDGAIAALPGVRGAVLLTVSLRGDPETLDRKLGRLLWVGRYLLERELDFEVRALTGSGVLCAHVDCETALQKAVDRLLCTPLAQDGTPWGDGIDACWQYHIGGDADET